MYDLRKKKPLLSRKGLIVFHLIIGSLSRGVFERRTATGNETFTLFTRLVATTFVILSVVTRIETIYLKTRAHSLPKNVKRPLPVAVCRSKTPLLKLPNIKKSLLRCCFVTYRAIFGLEDWGC